MLARHLDKVGITYEMADNAFLAIDDFARAQKLSNSLDAKQLHHRLNRRAKQLVSIQRLLHTDYQ